MTAKAVAKPLAPKPEAAECAPSCERLEATTSREAVPSPRLIDRLVMGCMKQVNIEGMTGDIIDRAAPKIMAATSMDEMADAIATRFQDELAAALTEALLKKLIDS